MWTPLWWGYDECERKLLISTRLNSVIRKWLCWFYKGGKITESFIIRNNWKWILMALDGWLEDRNSDGSYRLFIWRIDWRNASWISLIFLYNVNTFYRNNQI